MSLLVSKRLGVNVAPNISLVNVSPEPMQPPPTYQRSRLRTQNMRQPPPLLLPQRRRSSRAINNKSRSSLTFTPGSMLLFDGDNTDDTSTHSPRSKQNEMRKQRPRQGSKVSFAGDVSDEDSCEATKDNDDSNKSESPDVIDNRLYKRDRSASIQIRSQMKNARKVIDLLSGDYKKKKISKLNKIKGLDEKESQEQETKTRTRKISMEWFAKTINTKRMSFLNAAVVPPKDQFTGYQRFRRAARKVKNLIQVCQVCKSITLDQVSGEDWFAKMESIIDSSDEMLSKPQGPSHTRPFITFVQDKESKQLVQLTFDKSLFTRERRADYLLTETIRTLLKKTAIERTQDEENELLMFMKRAAPSFNEYALEAQRKLLKCMHYDKYEKDRVITRKNLMADGVYFILSGTLVEQADEKKRLREMKPGERFGDEDIVCGCPRKVTVITHSDVELMTIHRLDYRTIVHMADDSNDPKYLEICKEDIVFRHFPMRKLIENPGVWTVLSYKYGRLMVKDSNELEWIYIIKSGEAKIMKHLKAGKMDLAQRRKKVQKKIDEADPHAIQKKMIDFVSERDYLKSQYKVGHYQPRTSPRFTRCIQSAPARDQSRTLSPKDNTMFSLPQSPNSPMNNRPATSASGVSLTHPNAYPKAAGPGKISRRNTALKLNIPNNQEDYQQQENEVPKIEIDPGSARTEISQGHNFDQIAASENLEGSPCEPHTDRDQSKQSPRKENMHITIVDNNNDKGLDNNRKPSAYINTSSLKEDVKLPGIPLSRKGSRMSLQEDKKSSKLVNVPPFVQLESLHAGKVFGLRSVLDPSERGPSASLISGGCEVLQINKKFFMKHIDDAILSLIKVQYKQFPTEEELIDRLDNNFQWEEYKQNTVVDFLIQKGRISQDQTHTTEVIL